MVETTENTRPIKINVSNISELQALLDRDADCIVNIRRDIVMAQERELERARDALVKLKKQYDTARIGNKQKEHQLSTLNDKLRLVESFYDTHKDTISAHQVILDDLEKKIAVVDDNLAADRRTRKVLQQMSSRLEVEIERVKMRSVHVSQAADLKRTELHGHEGAVRSNRQELREEERKFAELMKLSKSRAAQRAARLAQLQSLALAEAMRSPKRTNDTQVGLVACDRRIGLFILSESCMLCIFVGRFRRRYWC
jgi:chromosome segregation ATPase